MPVGWSPGFVRFAVGAGPDNDPGLKVEKLDQIRGAKGAGIGKGFAGLEASGHPDRLGQGLDSFQDIPFGWWELRLIACDRPQFRIQRAADIYGEWRRHAGWWGRFEREAIVQLSLDGMHRKTIEEIVPFAKP